MRGRAVSLDPEAPRARAIPGRAAGTWPVRGGPPGAPRGRFRVSKAGVSQPSWVSFADPLAHSYSTGFRVRSNLSPRARLCLVPALSEVMALRGPAGRGDHESPTSRPLGILAEKGNDLACY